MATYREINGGSIQNRATNPSNVKEGEVWYNEDTGKLRYGKFTEGSPTSASWSSGGNLNTARYNAGAAGIQTSALFFAGGGNSALTESYNGSSWTEVGDLNTGRELPGGAGANNTAVIAFGGFISPPSTGVQALTESWNGSSWTEVR